MANLASTFWNQGGWEEAEKPIPELGLARLHHLHKQLLSLLPPALIPKPRLDLGHARQRGAMIVPVLLHANLDHVHCHLLILLSPPLLPILPPGIFLARHFVGRL